MRPHGRRILVLSFMMAVGLSLAPAPVAAHSFLADTQPAQGARLSSPPEEVAIQLSEAVVADAVDIRIVGRDGGELDSGRPEVSDDGRVVRLPLVDPPADLLSVSWHVTSAVDGHESAGEFSFAAGDVDAAAPEPDDAASGPGVPPAATAGTWLLFGGLSVASGVWLTARRRSKPYIASFPGRASTWLRAGTSVALLGLAVRGAAGGLGGAGATSVAALAAAALALALLLARLPLVWPSLAALAAAAIAWAGRGHAATLHGAVGWGLDAVHVVAAAAWAGGLLVVVVALARRATRTGEAAVLPLVARYARGALLLVAVLLASGVASAALLLTGWRELLAGGYGTLVTVKIVLLVLAGALALGARVWLLPAGRSRALRRLTRPELAAVAGALTVAAVLVDVAPPTPRADEADLDQLLGAPPMEGPVARAAGVAGHLMLDLQAGDGRLDLNVRSPSGGVDADLELVATLPDGRQRDLQPRPCGTGCATQSFDPPHGDIVLDAAVRAEDWPAGSTQLTFTWPPAPEQPQLFERMQRAMTGVERVDFAEASDEYPPPETVDSTLEGERLVELMPWAGGGVTDVRPVDGDPRRFTFYLPGSTMWFDVTVDEDARLVEQRLVNPGHDIRYRFRYPEAP